MTQNEVPKTIELQSDVPIVYLGVREGYDGKKLYGYYCLLSAINANTTIDKLEEIASPFDFAKKALPRTIGGIYTAPVRIVDGRIKSLAPTYKFIGDKITFEQITAACETRDHAARVSQRARKIEIDMAKDSAVARCLRPLQRSYAATDTIGRLALEVVILAELRKGRAT